MKMYSYHEEMRAAAIKSIARDCGFDLAGITPALPLRDSDLYLEWVARGYAGEMTYLTDRRGPMRTDPRSLLPSAKSIICAAKSYREHSVGTPTAVVARYAQAEDYHSVLKRDLQTLVARMEEQLGSFEHKICVDTAPLLERSYAREAGLGWIGRNTCLINQEEGSFLFLGEVLVSLELEPDQPVAYRCGTCSRCVDACPTNALVPAGHETLLDSTRCISYLTIEKKGAIPEESRTEVGTHVFGCDICQDVCPWNARLARDTPATSTEFDLTALASLSADEFRGLYRETPVWRSKHSGFLRNVAVAMGNSGDPRYVPALRDLAERSDEQVAGHARWALAKLAGEQEIGSKAE